jgi:Protein of unknown function (DUF3558)
VFTRSPRIPTLAGLIITVAIATAACSTPAAAGPTTAPVAVATGAAPQASAPAGDVAGPNPCLLVTDAAAATLLGGTPVRTGPKAEARGVSCTWDVAGGANLLVSVWQGKEFYAPDYTNPKATSLAGVGDKAFSDSLTQTVGFIKGSTVVMVFVPALTTVPMANIEQLARTIAAAI